jgi:hypothetical protein
MHHNAWRWRRARLADVLKPPSAHRLLHRMGPGTGVVVTAIRSGSSACRRRGSPRSRTGWRSSPTMTGARGSAFDQRIGGLGEAIRCHSSAVPAAPFAGKPRRTRDSEHDGNCTASGSCAFRRRHHPNWADERISSPGVNPAAPVPRAADVDCVFLIHGLGHSTTWVRCTSD